MRSPKQFRKYSNTFQSDIPSRLNQVVFRPTTSGCFPDGFNEWIVMLCAACSGGASLAS